MYPPPEALRARLRPLPAAPLVVRRRYMAVLPRSLPAVLLAERFRHSIVVLRPFAAVPWHCRSRRRTLGRCSAEQSKYYRLHLHRGMLALAAMYLRRVLVAGHSFVEALTHVLAARCYAACTCGTGP
jgi:hypothetical protein